MIDNIENIELLYIFTRNLTIMNKISQSLCILFAVVVLSGCGSKEKTAGPNELSGKITMSGAFALYPLAVKWGEEFQKLHPNVQFDIQGGGAGKGMTDVLGGATNLGMVSRDINDEEKGKGAFELGVCKDAVLPTFNAENPYKDLIYQKGITQQQFMDIWLTEKIVTWGDLLGNGATEKIEVYTRSDAAGAAEAWAKYLDGKKQEDLKGVGVMGDPGVAQAIVKSKFAIGYNNVGFAYDTETKIPTIGMAILPIDINADGKLDADENVYATIDDINAAILSGKYPSPPARPLYLVSKGAPSDKLVIAFLTWVLNEGQQYVAEAGYVKLPDDVINEQKAKLPASQTAETK